MRNRGLSRPGLNALICVAMILAGALATWTGATDMNALGHETTWTAVRIAFGILAVVLGFAFLANFIWGMRVVGAFKRGEGVIARWTVTPATFDQFRAFDRTLKGTAEDNDYKVPKVTPPAGIEVAFSADGVLINDTFFGLASSGLVRFGGVRLRQSTPPCLEFATVMTQGVAQPTVRFYNVHGVLRVPVADDARDEVAKVLRHYEDVVARRTIAKPHFWRTRIKIGLIGALVCGAIAAAGFSLSGMNEDLAQAPLIMAVAGTIFALGGLILALLAWFFEQRQRNG